MHLRGAEGSQIEFLGRQPRSSSRRGRLAAGSADCGSFLGGLGVLGDLNEVGKKKELIDCAAVEKGANSIRQPAKVDELPPRKNRDPQTASEKGRDQNFSALKK